eukprot:365509-Chlamydomonas_euryale.AAC.35
MATICAYLCKGVPSWYEKSKQTATKAMECHLLQHGAYAHHNNSFDAKTSSLRGLWQLDFAQNGNYLC